MDTLGLFCGAAAVMASVFWLDVLRIRLRP